MPESPTVPAVLSDHELADKIFPRPPGEPPLTPVRIPHTSASQVALFEKCERAWYFQSVEGLRSPPTPSQAFGTNTHKELENVLAVPNYRVKPDFVPIVTVAKSARYDARYGGGLVMPDPIEDLVKNPATYPTFRVEGEFLIPTYTGGPFWKGFIDLWLPFRKPPEVLDYKTTSDLRYAKTPDELLTDVQMVSYAKRGFIVQPEAKIIRTTHLYLTTRGKPKALPVTVDMDAEHVEIQWTRALGKVRKMVSLRSVASADDITPNGVDTGHCHAYGGCPYKTKCGIGPGQLVTISTKPKPGAKMSTPSLFEKLQRLRAGAAAADGSAPPAAVEAPPAAAPPAPSAAPPVGVVPPDAPPRTQPAETIVPPGQPVPVEPSEDDEELATAPLETPPASLGDTPPAPKKRGRPKGSKNAAKSTAPSPDDGGPLEVPKPAGVAKLCPACGGWAPMDTKGRFMDHPGVDADLKPYKAGMGVCVSSADTPEEAQTYVDETKRRQTAPPAPNPHLGSELDVQALATTGEVKTVPAPAPVPQAPELSRVAGPPAPAEAAPGPVAVAAGGMLEAIYVDCLPLKGPHKGSFTMMEDWLAPLAKMAAEANEVADYRLISYTSKGVLATAVNISRQAGEVPSVLVVSSYTPGSDVVLECLIPFSRVVIRALRG